MPKNYHQVRKATVIKQPNGQRVKLGGYRSSPIDDSDRTYQPLGSGDLPSKVDLRPFLTPVENQGATNSCTANAMAGAYEYLANRLQGNARDVSRLFIYYNARDLDGDTRQDEGTYLKSCIHVLQKYGACYEHTWPFNPDSIFDEPYSEAYDEGANFLIEDAYHLDVDLDAMRSCLAEGYPFAFGLVLFSSFQKAGKRGLVPMPDPEREQHDGGHAMLCVGYSDADKVFIVRNSWGEEWGDRGYCYIPYGYMANPDLNHDLWTVRQVSGTDVDLSEGIGSGFTSLFDEATAAMVAELQIAGSSIGGALWGFSGDDYDVEYEDQQVYVEDHGFVPVDEYEDLDNLYEDDSEDEEEWDEEDEDEDEEDEDEDEEDEDEDEEDEDEDEDEEDDEEDEDEDEDELEDEEEWDEEDDEDEDEDEELEDEDEDEEYEEDEEWDEEDS